MIEIADGDDLRPLVPAEERDVVPAHAEADNGDADRLVRIGHDGRIDWKVESVARGA